MSKKREMESCRETCQCHISKRKELDGLRKKLKWKTTWLGRYTGPVQPYSTALSPSLMSFACYRSTTIHQTGSLPKLITIRLFIFFALSRFNVAQCQSRHWTISLVWISLGSFHFQWRSKCCFGHFPLTLITHYCGKNTKLLDTVVIKKYQNKTICIRF